MRKSTPSLSSHYPKKHLGQNFLTDRNVQENIIKNCRLSREDIVLEIGPGKGVLTELIAPNVKELIVVETDDNLIPGLEEKFQNTNVKIIHADFLKFSFEQLPSGIKVIGNLPYYIATPIIERILLNRQKFSDFFLTIQWELGERLVAEPRTKDYSSLSCFVQYFCQPTLLFKIKNTAFKPVPKVQSGFLHLKIHHDLPLKAANEELLFKMIRLAFLQRRKVLPNALQSLFDREKLNEILKRIGVNPLARAEELSLAEFVKLADQLTSLETNA